MRTNRLFLIPAILIAVLGIMALGGGRSVAVQPAGTPCPSPAGTPAAGETGTPVAGEMGTPIANLGASPAASPAAEGCPEAGAGGGMTVEMVDLLFVPAELTIPADTDVTILLPNNGALPHNFNIDELNVHSETPNGGGSTQVTINAPAGTYEYYCNIPGHRESGMVGTLTVQ